MVVDELAQTGGRHAGGEVGCHRCENVAAVEGAAYGLAKIALGRNQPRLVLLAVVHHRQHAVVGPDEILARGFDQDWAASRAHARVHHRQVHRLGRKIAIRLRHQVGAFGDLVLLHLVADVDDTGLGVQLRTEPSR